MKLKKIEKIRRKCIFNDSYKIEVMLGHPNKFVKEWLVCFQDHIRFRLRFSLCPKLIVVLNHYNIIPTQILPSSIGEIIVAINFTKKYKVKWSVNLFLHLFKYSINSDGIIDLSSQQFIIDGLSNQR